MGYTVGTLDLPIVSKAKSATDEIQKTITKLERLHTVLNNLSSFKMNTTGIDSFAKSMVNLSNSLQNGITQDGINKVSSLSRIMSKVQQLGMGGSTLANYSYITTFFKEIANASTLVDTTSIEKIANLSTSLNGLATFSRTINKIDFDRAVQGFNNLATAIKPFLEVVNQSAQSLSSLDSVLQKVSTKKLQSIGGGSSSKGGSGGFASLFNLGKLTTVLYTMRRLANFVGSMVQAGSDYTESLNMWQVAMRENLNLADKFIIKMNKAYGISEKTLMNTQATFKNMIGSLGQISEDTAYVLSEALTQMAVDYSSLYNVKLNKAFEKFQAMLAGQVRPIRTVSGLDITETTLFQLYQSIGGTKSMRQLTRTEKQLLSILSVFKQMGRAGALGDMTKTLGQFANQSRMLTEYWVQLKSWTGVILKDLIEESKVLVYINALLITASEIMRAIAKSRGAGDENFIDGLFETTEATNQEIDELQGKLLDFDKFRSLEDGGAGDISIDQSLLDALAGYSSSIDQANNEAQKLAKEWLSIFGFTEDANGELTITEENLQGIYDKLKGIGLLLGVGGVVAIMSKFGLTVGLVISGLSVALGLLVHFYNTNDEVKNSVDNLWETLKSTLETFKTLSGFIDQLKMSTESFGNVLSVLIDMLNFGLGALGLNMLPIVASFEALLKIVITLVDTWDALLNDDFSDMKKKLKDLWGKDSWVTANFAKNSWNTAGKPFKAYATGGAYDKGDLFVANEKGTELIYSNSNNGGGGVLTLKQYKEASKQGTYEALNTWWNRARTDIPQLESVGYDTLYKGITAEASRVGNGWTKK